MKTAHRFAICFCVVAISLVTLLPSPSRAAPPYEQRWFYAAFNELVDKQTDELVALIERAGKDGYNGVMLADYKLNLLDSMDKRYFQNVERTKKAAAAANIEIIPAVFPIGYSSGLLAHDPNLAEGPPVKDAPFIVKDGQAVLDLSAAAVYKNGDLEEAKGDKFTSMSFQDDPGKHSFVDHDVVHGGKSSARLQDIGGANCRITQKVKVHPYAAYRFSAWIKTQDLSPTGGCKLMALGAGKGGRPLTFDDLKLAATQDWQQVSVVFNSADQEEVNLYAGQWGGRSGKLWIDDLKLEQLGPINILRREGCPLKVTSADGKTVYQEGKDFEHFADPKLGQVPYRGEFSYDHPAPPIKLTANSAIKDGDHLLVSWYHPIIVNNGEQVACCLTDEKVYTLLKDQAKRVNDLFHPKTFFMSHDEMRVAGWCETCQHGGHTPGQLLAENVKRCVAILHEVNPDARVIVWSDMFDPHHNAHDNYYFVNGTLEGSWEGLDKKVMLANWNSGHAAESLKFFADRGHEQVIAGYYDHDLKSIEKWNAAAKGVQGVNGFMYTTWQHKYELLDQYGKALQEK